MAPPPPPVADIDNVIDEVWNDASKHIMDINPATENWKAQALPLARIKKIMKSDDIISTELEREKEKAAGKEDINASGGPGCATSSRFMIAGEAPVLLGKACEFLIKELTARAWRHTERNRRRTLQRQDVHAAVGESEVYDFLIDIVPRVPQQGTPAGAPTGAAYTAQASGEQAAKEGAAPAPVPPPGTAPASASTPPAVPTAGSAPATEQAGSVSSAENQLRMAQYTQMQEYNAVMMQRIQAGDLAAAAAVGLGPANPAAAGGGGLPPAATTPAAPATAPGATPHIAVGLAAPQTMGLYVQHPGQDPAVQWTHQAAVAYTSQQQQQQHQQQPPPPQPPQQQQPQQSSQQSQHQYVSAAQGVSVIGTSSPGVPNNGSLAQSGRTPG